MKRVRLTSAGRSVPLALNEARLSALADLITSLDDDQAGALQHALGLLLERREEIAAYRPAQTPARTSAQGRHAR
jgi:hypothetical protein